MNADIEQIRGLATDAIARRDHRASLRLDDGLLRQFEGDAEWGQRCLTVLAKLDAASAALYTAKLALAMSAGFIHGGSIASRETVLAEVREAFLTIEGV